MTNYERLILRLISENKLKEFDCVDLNFASHCCKHNVDPTIRHNMVCTLTTHCEVAVVLKADE